MAKSIFITFDSYYDTKAYNSFLTASKNNGIEYEEYLRVRQPFYRFLKLKSKSDLPSFVNYDFATGGDKKFLVSLVKPVYSNEELKLKRKPGQDALYYSYILPRNLEEATKEKYMMVFKAKSFSELSDYSKKLGEVEIYKWGEAKVKGFKIYYCYNPRIKGFIPRDKVLMEFGKDADSGMKHDKTIPKVKGDLEYYLNHFVLIKEKLEDKTYEAEIWYNGIIKPLKKATFI